MVSTFPLKKGAAARIVFPILDADGDPVSGAAGLDSEVSIDGGAFADCTNEAVEIGTSGIYYLDLTADETNGDVICVQVKTTTSGAKTTVLVFYTAGQTLDDMQSDITAIKNKTDKLNFNSDATPLVLADVRDVNDTAVTGVDDFKADVSNLDVAVSTRSSHTPADVWNYTTRALTDKSDFNLAADQSGVTIGTVNNVGDKTGYELSASGIDAILDDVLEGTLTVRQAIRIILAAAAGKSTGGGTSTIRFRDLADSKDRIVATVDSDGNRTDVTLDGT